MNLEKKIKSHRDLLVWQKSCGLIKKSLTILKAVKKDFISWVIIRQLINSLFSIRANIVEGWYSHRGKSFASYLEIARGSTGESEDWFYALFEERYITREIYEDISNNCNELIAMLTSFINKIRQK